MYETFQWLSYSITKESTAIAYQCYVTSDARKLQCLSDYLVLLFYYEENSEQLVMFVHQNCCDFLLFSYSITKRSSERVLLHPDPRDCSASIASVALTRGVRELTLATRVSRVIFNTPLSGKLHDYSPCIFSLASSSAIYGACLSSHDKDRVMWCIIKQALKHAGLTDKVSERTSVYAMRGRREEVPLRGE